MQTSTDTHQIRNGEFGWPSDASQCLAIYSSPDCGISGTIREDAIHFTATLNGRPTSNQWARGPMETAKTSTLEFVDLIRSFFMRTAFRLTLAAILTMTGTAPSLAQQFDGARYMWRTKTTGGGHSVTHYEVKGNSIIRTTQQRDSLGHVDMWEKTFPLTGNHFTSPLPSEQCLEAFSTTSCGIRGTLSNSEIRFTTVINGRDTGRYQSIRFIWDMEPAKRQH